MSTLGGQVQARLTGAHLGSSAPSCYPNACVVWPQLLSAQGLLQVKTAKSKLTLLWVCLCRVWKGDSPIWAPSAS